MEPSEPTVLPLPAPVFNTRSGSVFSFLPDGERMVLSGTGPKSVSRIISITTGQDILVFDKPPQNVSRNAVSDDGTLVALASLRDQVTVYDAQTSQRKQTLRVGNDADISGFTFVPGSHDLLHASWHGLTALDADANGKYMVRPLHVSLPYPENTMYHAIAFAASGNRFACTWSRHTVGTEISLYAWPSGDEVAQFPCQHYETWHGFDQIVFTPDDHFLASVTQDGSVVLWPLRKEMPSISDQSWLTGRTKLPDVEEARMFYTSRLCFSQDGTLLAHSVSQYCSLPDGTLLAQETYSILGLWAWPARKCLGRWRLPGRDPMVRQVGFSPTGRDLVLPRGSSPGVSVYRVADLLN